ncbi:lactate/malate dehydrogenase family protein [Nitrosomonas sp.]|uniref:malate dehydrogenase n=1 Tax=Nitrosomonas sp. TaxID=42353 RepID=UPI001D5E11AC|nr:lactate/malate dehydrogenase family protein [Nitrosomonas sp.]MCB1950161.1 lactate/malate dehydrogenase family protein [Nitrosomonas sp.]
MKISIIGTGNVGSTIAYTAVLKGLCNHLVLAGRNVTKAQGDALDLQHTLSFCERPMIIESSAIEEVRDSDILVITASAKGKGKMTSRMELGAGNVKLFKKMIPALIQNNPAAVIVIISNPVDVLTYLTTQIAGLPSSRIMGIGTLVDSARFRVLLSHEEKIHPDDLRTYILGEHGPNQFPVFSNAFAGSERIADNSVHRKIFEEVTEAGFDVYNLKGYTNYAIATATCEVLKAIVFDDHRTMPLSIYFREWQGIEDNCFSIPVVVGRTGVIRHLHPKLNQVEKTALEKTAKLMKQNINKLVYNEK